MAFGLRYFDSSTNTVVTQQSSSELGSAFVPRYFAELRSKYKEVFWRLEVAERGFTGSAEEMAFDGSAPLTITWERRGDEFFIPVKGSEATVNVLCVENFRYLGLFTSDPRKYRVSIYRNTKLYWRGYVVADLYSENFTAPPYQVSIKAVDGFNLLSSVPFLDSDKKPFAGRKSLWNLVAMCVDLLELGVDVADWMDLYGAGMNESQSPLRQVYVEMSSFYAVYDEPTYRDVLELCLRPFAAQIFQSNGALHIRRVVSLYNDVRPLSFYAIGSQLPSGWLVTADGQNLVTHTGEPLITQTTRDRIDSMWDGHINVQGESVLEISPALRKVTVEVTNILQENLLEKLGIFDLNAWNDTSDCVSIVDPRKLRFNGNDDHQGVVVKTSGVAVEQCEYKLVLEFSLAAEYYKVIYGMGGARPPRGFSVDVEFAFTITKGDGAVLYLNEDGAWRAGESYLGYNVKLDQGATKKIEIKGFSESGLFAMHFRQTMQGWVSDVGVYRTSCRFDSLTLKMDSPDLYKDALTTEVKVNPANNLDMAITLPIADVAVLPNNTLLYALFFTDHNNAPTSTWHSKGKSDKATLIQHIVACALQFKQTPPRRVAAKMFTGKHIDMNTVVQDEKFLRAGFYVNSLELDCLGDEYNGELVEMPKLLPNQ